MSVEDLAPHRKDHSLEIKAQLLAVTYRPLAPGTAAQVAVPGMWRLGKPKPIGRSPRWSRIEQAQRTIWLGTQRILYCAERQPARS
jgi:hypothetical protein